MLPQPYDPPQSARAWTLVREARTPLGFSNTTGPPAVAPPATSNMAHDSQSEALTEDPFTGSQVGGARFSATGRPASAVLAGGGVEGRTGRNQTKPR